MNITREQFEEVVSKAMDDLPDKLKQKINNLAVFVEDFPTNDQLGKAGRKERYELLGLFEGYAQAQRLNYGAVLPDRITIFRMPILKSSRTVKECEDRIKRVIRHEIAHHFGSGEPGARKAEID
ncbi:metallopeptidase family protein [bacterium]|nr:metallopeptidase family protein [bacterium]